MSCPLQDRAENCFVVLGTALRFRNEQMLPLTSTIKQLVYGNYMHRAIPTCNAARIRVLRLLPAPRLCLDCLSLHCALCALGLHTLFLHCAVDHGAMAVRTTSVPAGHGVVPPFEQQSGYMAHCCMLVPCCWACVCVCRGNN